MRRLVFLLFLLAGIALAPGYVDNVDSRIILRTAERLVTAGTWDMGDVGGTYVGSTDYGARGPDGSYQMKFGPGNALIVAPFVAAGRIALTPLGLSAEQAGEAGAAFAPALWFALIGLFSFDLARRFLDERAAAAAAALTGFATYLAVYAKSAYLEVPLTAALLGAYVAALRLRDTGRASAGVALALACAAVLWIKFAVLALAAGAAPLVLTRDVLRRRTAVAATTGVFAAATLLFLALNHVRFGDAFATGYATSVRFWSPLGPGVTELLLSPRGGLLPYSPLFVLAVPGTFALARRDARLAVAASLTTAAALVLYGTWCSPLGGDVWGARYLLPVAALLGLPASLAAVELWRRGGLARAAAAAVVAYSALLQVPPALVSFQEIYSLRPQWLGRDDAPAAQRLSARILAEKLRSADGTYDLARLGLGDGRHTPGRVELGINLWPVRVSRDLPRRTSLAWGLWTVTALGAAGTAVAIARRGRSA